MHIKKLIQAAAAVLCLVSLNAFATQDIVVPVTSELAQLKSGKKVDESRDQMHKQPRIRMDEHERQGNGGVQSDMGWNTELQPYVDAHRRFGLHS